MAHRVNKYLLLQADSKEKLQMSVNSWLNDGWQPQGGIAHVWRLFEDQQGFEEIHHEFTQAIIKHGS